MNEYIFLFGLAFVYIAFAIIHDFKTKEIPNWLNFSLIAFVLAYRAFYGIFSNNLMFFVYGLIGIIIFVIIGYAFYYGRIFAGGDAKLLMGFGGILPYERLEDYFYIGGGFIFILFLIGSIWALIYSLFLVNKNIKKFVKEFKKELTLNKKIIYLALIFVIFLSFILFFFRIYYFLLLLLIIILLPLFYIYSRSVDNSFMVKFVSPDKLTEGDWLLKDVKIGKRVIKKTVHGLTKHDIELLRKARKKLWIRDGVPFTPAFLFALIFMIVFLLRYSLF